MYEPAVLPARPGPADGPLDQGDADARVALVERERRPQARVAAAHDRDVDVDAPLQRRSAPRERCRRSAPRRAAPPGATTASRAPAARRGATSSCRFSSACRAPLALARTEFTAALQRGSRRRDIGGDATSGPADPRCTHCDNWERSITLAGMALTLRETLEFDLFKRSEPEIVAGWESLDRPLRWVHISELADVGSLIKGGELILTTGMGLDGLPGRELRHFVDDLAAALAAGIVVELGRTFTEPPADLVDAASGPRCRSCSCTGACTTSRRRSSCCRSSSTASTRPSSAPRRSRATSRRCCCAAPA